MAGGPESWDDETLARRSALREDRAWRELLRRCGGAAEGMMRRVFARSGSPESAREASEALGDWAAALLENDAALLRAYWPRAPLRAYLAVIARSVAVRMARRSPRGLPLDPGAAEAPGRAPAEFPAGPEALAKALSTLPSRDRLLLRLVYWDACSYDEAAGVLGVAPSSLGPLLTRARHALRQALESEKACPEFPAPG